MDARFDGLANNIPQAFYGFLITLVLILIGLLNIHITPYNIMLSWLPLMSIYLWPRFAAPLWSLGLVFLAGLIQDSLNAQPLGLSSLIFILTFTFFRSQVSRKTMTVWKMWQKYIYIVIAIGMGLAVLNLLQGDDIIMEAIALNLLVTVILFPVYFAIWRFLRNLFFVIEDI